MWRAAGMMDDDVIIVAGDRNTPHEAVTDLLAELPGDNRYLAPSAQLGWKTSEAVGWNSVQRRNVALLEAIALKPEWIMTVDDDNWPDEADQWGMVHRALSEATTDATVIIDSSSGWFNPLVMFGASTFHRGFPITQRDEIHVFTEVHDALPVGVHASLWRGDPDVDAATRLALGRVATDRMSSHWHPGAALAPGTWAPFNSQAVAYRAELAPLMMVWPGVGRYDDVWASYLARCVMDHLGYLVWYGEPLVTQTRNEHDIFADLDAELFGMRHTEELCAVLRDVTFGDESTNEDWSSAELGDFITRCYSALDELPWLPDQTRDGFEAWLTDLQALGAL
jgi:hypothetical protein